MSLSLFIKWGRVAMSLERFLRLHPVLKFGNFSTRVHPSCEGLGRPLLRNQHQCGAEPVDQAWQSHALSVGTLKARSPVARGEAGVLTAIPGIRDPARQDTSSAHCQGSGTGPAHLPSSGCVPELVASALNCPGCPEWQRVTH